MNRSGRFQNENIPGISVPVPKAEVKLSGIGDKSVILNFEGIFSQRYSDPKFRNL